MLLLLNALFALFTQHPNRAVHRHAPADRPTSHALPFGALVSNYASLSRLTLGKQQTRP